MTSATITVSNRLGMHARAAARFVQTASGFSSRIRVCAGAREMDGKSILGLLLLAAGCGTAVTLTAEGPDEAAAIEALSALVASGFGEGPWSD